jgi:SAM-dependent methyltransferase
MPDCRHCRYLVGERCTAEPRGSQGGQLRHCVQAITSEYIGLIPRGSRVLEIGCGAWSPLHEAAPRAGYHWEGIDVNDTYQGRPGIATKIASVAEIPFADRSFDFVIATQSMEHWEEYRVSLRKGLSEVFRVLVPGGQALLNFPLYFHGGPLFVRGHLDELRALVEPFASEVQVERWRPSAPVQPVRTHLASYWGHPTMWLKTGEVADLRARRRDDVPYFDDPPVGALEKLWSGLRYRGVTHYGTLAARLALKRLRTR